MIGERGIESDYFSKRLWASGSNGNQKLMTPARSIGSRREHRFSSSGGEQKGEIERRDRKERSWRWQWLCDDRRRSCDRISVYKCKKEDSFWGFSPQKWFFRMTLWQYYDNRKATYTIMADDTNLKATFMLDNSTTSTLDLRPQPERTSMTDQHVAL
jgi:hypothetical protein